MEESGTHIVIIYECTQVVGSAPLKVPLVISPALPEAATTFWWARRMPPFSRRIRP